MAEKKDAEVKNEVERTMVYINGLSANMIQPAAQFGDDRQPIRDADGNIVPDEKYVQVSIYDVDETRYTFKVPKSFVKDSKSSSNKNVMLYEEPGKQLNVSVKKKDAETYERVKMTPSELHNIQEEKHLSRVQDKSKLVWLNGIDKTNPSVYAEVAEGKRARISGFQPGGFEDGSPRRFTLYVSKAHVHDVEGNEKMANLSLMNDSNYRVMVEPTRSAKIADYVPVDMSGQELADAWKASKDEAKKWAQEHAAAAEEAAPAEAEVEVDELEA